MAKRLHMTTADYVTIAVSPALVMALVGSLVFFLIEVLYVGDYQARLMYVFALFVFAAVLVARISIEMGSEYASLFALPLGLATFLVLVKFVEHPSPFSWLINIALMMVVWWCAHKLTWDCTLIDDEEDASGEGLMQRIGVDETNGVADNELLAEPDEAAEVPWWRQWLRPKKGKHTPGLWVLYFSLAALPLFGLGQHWIPPAEVGRRRYVFALLSVYVAAALALLVTTSFLGLRRYLRQRRVEMPDPMAATWMAIGAVLIVVVMLLAALIPRPHAEYAISQVPWQVRSPDGVSSSHVQVGRDGSDEPDEIGRAVQEDAPQGDAVQQGASGEPAESEDGTPSGKADGESEEGGTASDENTSEVQGSETVDSESAEREVEHGENATEGPSETQQTETAKTGRPANAPLPQHPPSEQPLRLPQSLPLTFGNLTGLLKIILYAAFAILAAVFVWRNRRALAQAIAEIMRQFRELLARLFGGRSRADAPAEKEAMRAVRRERSFAEFRDPFASGEFRRLPPEELVRYTFEAFEAWARDGGHPRSPDETPAELVRAATAPQTPLSDEARRMVRLYSEVAYASGTVSRESADSLREIWTLMRANPPGRSESLVAG